jgi:uncharacterized membrane protein (UPF0127 family)
MRDGEVLATLEVADSAVARLKGLVGRRELDGAVMLRPPVLLHTLGVPLAVDVAFCDAELQVLTTVWLNTWRVALPRLHARRLIIARAGAFERWHLAVGDRLEVKGG